MLLSEKWLTEESQNFHYLSIQSPLTFMQLSHPFYYWVGAQVRAVFILDLSQQELHIGYV
jgi:hypothetical protein